MMPLLSDNATTAVIFAREIGEQKQPQYHPVLRMIMKMATGSVL